MRLKTDGTVTLVKGIDIDTTSSLALKDFCEGIDYYAVVYPYEQDISLKSSVDDISLMVILDTIKQNISIDGIADVSVLLVIPIENKDGFMLRDKIDDTLFVSSYIHSSRLNLPLSYCEAEIYAEKTLETVVIPFSHSSTGAKNESFLFTYDPFFLHEIDAKPLTTLDEAKDMLSVEKYFDLDNGILLSSSLDLTIEPISN